MEFVISPGDKKTPFFCGKRECLQRRKPVFPVERGATRTAVLLLSFSSSGGSVERRKEKIYLVHTYLRTYIHAYIYISLQK